MLAAGALCWRIRKKELQVLLIHRPRYDDWSWPKGKYDHGETLPQTAVREVREEVGLKISLGIPLPEIDYRVNSGLKRVYYWAAETGEQKPVPDGKEVDAVLWATPQRARELLTNPSDVIPLDVLSRAFEQQQLATWPLIVLRHAKAKPRSSWTRAEGDRPLAATGQRQAAAVKRLLSAWSPKRVISSPWLRCVATVSAYVKASDAKIKLVDALTEAEHRRKPKKTAAVLDGVLDKHRPVVVCVHRPTLPTVLNRLKKEMPEGLAERLPSADPYLSPGELLVFQVCRDRIVAVERFRPFDD